MPLPIIDGGKRQFLFRGPAITLGYLAQKVTRHIANQMRQYADGPEGIDRVTPYTIEVRYAGFTLK